MTNDQQAYDRAMAHNVMLREALDHAKGGLMSIYSDDDYRIAFEPVINAALNATEADVTAWLQQRDAKWLSNQETAVQLWSNAEQQLATVTNERDALREKIKALHNVALAEARQLLDEQLGAGPYISQSPPSK